MTNTNPYDKAHELARAIKNSPVYQDYVAAKNRVELNPAASEKILSFRNRQLEINRAQLMGEQVSPEKVSEVANEFARLNTDQEMADFFRAEANFIQMFNDVQEIIHQAIESELK